ncbi:MAG: hypothetical protein HQK56_11260 [Deltaproteobacteria bacterium]|nr:hypothetical protein [Deltaproteobacteria bacterium]
MGKKKSHKENTSLTNLPFKPGPKRLNEAICFEDVSKHRFLDCANYMFCLTLAEKWRSFSCEDCPDWSEEARKRAQSEQVYEDLEEDY